jgi:SAM-dependent methyltransferase
VVKPRLLQLLVCPDCQAPLDCEAKVKAGEDIVQGTLTCQSCGQTFPIRGSVPRFVSTNLEVEKRQTAKAFGWEWHRFVELGADVVSDEEFADRMAPLEPSQFAGRTVLEAGCGMGRWIEKSAEFGAADVVGLDLSDSVEVAQQRLGHLPNVHFVQADIMHMPFPKDGRASLDIAYSVGVIHHMPDPEAGFDSVAHAVRPGGMVYVWVYGRENNEWIVRFVNPLRTGVFSRMPAVALYAITLLLAGGLHAGLKAGIKPLIGRPGARKLPYFPYLAWLSAFGFRHTHHIVFDHLVPPTAYYIAREEVEAWFRRARLDGPRLVWRNRNSWGALGLKAAALES